MIVINIEASASIDGYPIGIGWARQGGECCVYLIKPTEKLIAHTKWDPVAEIFDSRRSRAFAAAPWRESSGG
jgi:hypothetical protein